MKVSHPRKHIFKTYFSYRFWASEHESGNIFFLQTIVFAMCRKNRPFALCTKNGLTQKHLPRFSSFYYCWKGNLITFHTTPFVWKSYKQLEAFLYTSKKLKQENYVPIRLTRYSNSEQGFKTVLIK